MKKYNVGFLTANNDQYEGREPLSDIYDFDSVQDYVEADSKWEAIDFALSCLAECISSNALLFDAMDFEVDRDKQEITVYNKYNKVVAHYFNFKAEEVEP